MKNAGAILIVFVCGIVTTFPASAQEAGPPAGEQAVPSGPPIGAPRAPRAGSWSRARSGRCVSRRRRRWWGS